MTDKITDAMVDRFYAALPTTAAKPPRRHVEVALSAALSASFLLTQEGEIEEARAKLWRENRELRASLDVERAVTDSMRIERDAALCRVKVCDLVWEEINDRNYKAQTVIGEYQLQGVTANTDYRWYFEGDEMRPSTGYYRPFEDAKAAAQEHFNAAIRSALSLPLPVQEKEDDIGPYEQMLRDAVEPFLDWLEQRESGACIQEVRDGLIGVEDVIPDSHVVLGAHLRADADEEITVGHFRRLRDAYEGKSSAAPSAVQEKPVASVAGWQPIETAPKDGTRVYLWNKNAGVTTRNVRWVIEEREGNKHPGCIMDGWKTDDMDAWGCLVPEQFSHWMLPWEIPGPALLTPLPASPSTVPEAQGTPEAVERREAALQAAADANGGYINGKTKQIVIAALNVMGATPNAEAHRHAVALRQCSLFAADVGEHIVKAMIDAADYLDRATTSHGTPAAGDE